MRKETKTTIEAKGISIAVHSGFNQADYISITDIARYKSDDPNAVLQNWLRNRETLEFLGLWEKLNNPGFKPLEFEGFRKEAGRNAFTMSPKKGVETTGAIGIKSNSGRYGGTFIRRRPIYSMSHYSELRRKNGGNRTRKRRVIYGTMPRFINSLY